MSNAGKAPEKIEDITRWREDMNFMFEYQEQFLTSERILITEFLMTFRKFATTFQKLKLSEDNLKFPRL